VTGDGHTESPGERGARPAATASGRRDQGPDWSRRRQRL